MSKSTISKILIANRGEIACRIIRTAHKLGIECVAIYSDADQYSQHVQLADEAWHVGASPAKQSYLCSNKILEIAKSCKADAVHPGYGFLSENADFADACQKNNIIFVGPPADAIRAMGSKSEAKHIMSAANVPLVSGYHGDNQDENLLHQEANKIGYPLLIKATAGGGGKGMRVVNHSEEFLSLLASCKREALSSFADDKVLIEKYLTKPRHIEIQVFADSHDNALFLFERDCSVQRRHQKVIEEAPAPGLDEITRNEMGRVALTAAKAIGYQGAGTVEFLYDEDGSFYFMEMNTRLQVEHPVTEKITGQDLVEWQIIVASGQPLPCKQDELSINGHAFEARIYAEDPNNDFLPVTGKISHLALPAENQHVRVDSGIIAGDEVSIYYDPMIAKLIVWDHDRDSALARLRAALTEFHVSGLTTNIEFLHQLASHDAFKAADLETHFLDKHGDELYNLENNIPDQIIASAALQVMLGQTNISGADCSKTDRFSPWNAKSGWRLNEDNHHHIEFKCGEEIFSVTAHFRDSSYDFSNNTSANSKSNTQSFSEFLFEINAVEYPIKGYLLENKICININGHQSIVSYSRTDQTLVLFKNASHWELEIVDNRFEDFIQEQQPNLQAPMPGTIIDVLVSEGDEVEQGQAMIVMEAMKMEHTITAHKNAQIAEIIYQVGDLVDEGAELITFVEEE